MSHVNLANISKKYSIYERPEGKWGLLKGAFKRNKKIINALQEISFSINQGELVGLIGFLAVR